MAILSAKPKRGSGGHWYTATGEPRHTMPLAKGDGERNTTLRDAKKHKLFPSVTGILGLFAKPGLDRWKQDQLLRIAYDNPRKMDETFERFADRCLLEHEKPVEEAATLVRESTMQSRSILRAFLWTMICLSMYSQHSIGSRRINLRLSSERNSRNHLSMGLRERWTS